MEAPVPDRSDQRSFPPRQTWAVAAGTAGRLASTGDCAELWGVEIQASAEDRDKRLDVFLSQHYPDSSRSRIQQWIRDGRVVVGQAPARASLRLRGTETVVVDPAPAAPLKAFAEDIPLDILHEDDDIVAVNKPAGMIVHSGAGAKSGTLVNALLNHFSTLSAVAGELRPGIVHRLDRMTSGVLLAAKNDRAHQYLARQFQGRQIQKTYRAIVHGKIARQHPAARKIESDGCWWYRLEMPIGRDSQQRIKMSTRYAGRPAQTDFRALKQSASYSLLEVRIATGRTHQIRVHLSKIGHPVVGDRLYGAPAAPEGLPKLDRFYLHAHKIGFLHPATHQGIVIEAPLPKEFAELTRLLQL